MIRTSRWCTSSSPPIRVTESQFIYRAAPQPSRVLGGNISCEMASAGWKPAEWNLSPWNNGEPLPDPPPGGEERRVAEAGRPAPEDRAHAPRLSGTWCRLSGTTCRLSGKVPRLSGTARHTCGMARHTCGTAPHTCGTAPHTCGTAPHTCGTARHTCGTARHTCGTAPHTCGTAPDSCRCLYAAFLSPTRDRYLEAVTADPSLLLPRAKYELGRALSEGAAPAAFGEVKALPVAA